MKATEQFLIVVLFITMYKVVLTFKPVDEILKCDHTNNGYLLVLSCGVFTMQYKAILTFGSMDEIVSCDH